MLLEKSKKQNLKRIRSLCCETMRSYKISQCKVCVCVLISVCSWLLRRARIISVSSCIFGLAENIWVHKQELTCQILSNNYEFQSFYLNLFSPKLWSRNLNHKKSNSSFCLLGFVFSWKKKNNVSKKILIKCKNKTSGNSFPFFRKRNAK